MIDPRRLEALVAVARTGSVTAAADVLGCRQPTVTHHLGRLEAETGAVLLQRVGRGVRLTSEGRMLAERGEEILGLLRRAESELSAATSLQSGRVRLAAFPSSVATLVPRVLAALAMSAPGLSLDLVEAEPPEATELLRSGEVDVALTFSYDQPAPAGSRPKGAVTDTDSRPDGIPAGPSGAYAVTPLFEDPLFLVLPAGHPRMVAPVDLARHRDERWVAGCERCRTELVDLCGVAGFEPEVSFASDDYVAAQALVASGAGVTLLPALALRAHTHPGVRALPVPAAHRQVQATTYGQPPRPRSIEAVVAALVEVGRSS